MKWTTFPPRIAELEPYIGRFKAVRLVAEGCEVLFGSYHDGTIIEPHCHATDNYGVITKGEMTITIDHDTTSYQSGDWYHVAAGDLHAAACRGDTEVVEFWFEKR